MKLISHNNSCFHVEKFVVGKYYLEVVKQLFTENL